VTMRIERRRALEGTGLVQLEVTVGATVAIAKAALTDDSRGMVAIGESKRAPGDPWDGGVAADLAAGRALQILGAALVQQAGS
jgi:hypothetical protein